MIVLQWCPKGVPKGVLIVVNPEGVVSKRSLVNTPRLLRPRGVLHADHVSGWVVVTWVLGAGGGGYTGYWV